MNRTLRLLHIGFGPILGGGLCVWLVIWAGRQDVDWNILIKGFSWPHFIGIVVTSGLLMLLSANKWAVLATALNGDAGEEPYIGFFLHHTLWQNWVGQFVPPTLAVIGGRGLAAQSMPTLGARDGLINALWDQGLEYAFFIGLAPAGAAYLWLDFPLKTSLILAGAGTLVMFGASLGAMFFLQKKLLRHALSILELSVARTALTLGRLALGAPALGLMLKPLMIAAGGAIVALAALIPVAPGNLGIAEWGWVGTFALAGQDVGQIALFALGFRVLVFLAQTILVLAERLVLRVVSP